MMYQLTGKALNFAAMAVLQLFSGILCVFIMLSGTAMAVVVDDLFEVQMPVLNESQAIRSAAMDDGLLEVLIRVSGDSQILEKLALPSASSYVQQFEYSVQETDSPTDPATTLLWVRYNETRILQLLRQYRIPIWGEHRQQAVFWLAIRDGGQRYILSQQNSSEIKSRVNTALQRRGIPAAWPQYDATDQATVGFADVWAGFAGPLKKASQRYSSGPVIAASLGWDGKLWRGEWSLFMADETRKWRLSGADYASLITRAIDLAADVLGQKYAVLEALDSAEHKLILLEIDQVNSVESFRRIEKYLGSLSAVKSMQLVQAKPETVLFELSLRTRAEDLLRLIKTGRTLRQLDEVMASAEATSPAASEAMPADNNQLSSDDALPASTITPDYRFVLRQ